jgi:hypothetical protein
MDLVYLLTLACSLAGAVATDALIREAPGGLGRSVGLPLSAFWGTFTVLLILAHRRERLLLRYWVYQGRKALSIRTGGQSG